MKHTFIIPFLLLGLLAVASGCSETEIDGGGQPEGAKTGLAITARISKGTGSTRAIGDPFAAALEEKRIDRLAFFVHTDEDGFQVYPPVPDDQATGDKDLVRTDYPNNVYLSGSPELGYNAEVSLTAGGGYHADIIAIANLPADYDYNQIVTWKGLQDSVAVWNTEMPVCLPGSAEALADRKAFVMYGDCVKELVKEEANPVSFDMSRLVARIDVTNEAYVSGATPDNHDALGQNGFLLTSVKLLRAKPAAYLVPKPETPDVETTNNWAPLQTPGTDILYGKPTTKNDTENPTREPDEVADVNDATLQYAWHSLYTNPNDDVEHAPTALEIKGWYRGTEVTRQIAFVDKDKKPFPIVGNHRYLVRIAKAPGQTDLSYTITVSEWDAVDTVNVKPDQTAVPEIMDITTDMTPNVTDPSIKMYDLFYTVDGKISFDATCAFAPDIRVKYYDARKEAWTAQSPYEADWLTVTKTDAELIPVTKAETTPATPVYRRHFEVALKPFSSGITRKAMLLVHNGGSEVECDTIHLRQVLTYPGTDIEPVLYEDIIWAPVNCGATEVATDLSMVTDSKKYPTDLSDADVEKVAAQIGYLYQWGRNVPFKYSKTIPDSVSFSTTFFASVKYADACKNEGEYADKYIYGPGGWFDDYSDVFATNKEWPRENQPCPTGWHVSTKAETDKLKDKTVTIEKGIVKFSDSSFLLSMTPYFLGNSGYSRFERLEYWTSTSISGTSFYSLVIKENGFVDYASGINTFAMPVRCIQNTNP